jgi:hypothetical protein
MTPGPSEEAGLDAEEYPWYRVVQGTDLVQGYLLERCIGRAATNAITGVGRSCTGDHPGARGPFVSVHIVFGRSSSPRFIPHGR